MYEPSWCTAVSLNLDGTITTTSYRIKLLRVTYEWIREQFRWVVQQHKLKHKGLHWKRNRVSIHDFVSYMLLLWELLDDPVDFRKHPPNMTKQQAATQQHGYVNMDARAAWCYYRRGDGKVKKFDTVARHYIWHAVRCILEPDVGRMVLNTVASRIDGPVARPKVRRQAAATYVRPYVPYLNQWVGVRYTTLDVALGAQYLSAHLGCTITVSEVLWVCLWICLSKSPTELVPGTAPSVDIVSHVTVRFDGELESVFRAIRSVRPNISILELHQYVYNTATLAAVAKVLEESTAFFIKSEFILTVHQHGGYLSDRLREREVKIALAKKTTA